MANSSFFEELQEQSRVKAAIVAKYFWAWAKVIVNTQKRYPARSSGKIAYIDLFAGPGRYRDGATSTPLLILEKAIQDPDLREQLVVILNDKDESNTRSLQQEINHLPGIHQLKHQPQVFNEEVGDQIVKMFTKMHLVPTLFFVDPWGYKGLSLQLINSVLKDWGCDCIFFFNYNRINMGLGNEFVKAHMDALFGNQRADALRRRLEEGTPYERELSIVEEICQALREMGGEYVLPFRFKDERGCRTTHHLIFVSKHVRGYEIMKDIMAQESSKLEQGVPTFEYNPTDAMYPILFEFSRPLDDLADMLLNDFAGQDITVRQIYERHHIGKRYIVRNYKDALRKLEAEGKIKADPLAERRRKRKGEVTFADTVRVKFSPKGDE
ncbi:MAG: three-Cys-motif partner protein TcmP [Chloroflexota bacterium]